VIRVAVDVTPLIGQRTGIGVLTAGFLEELGRRRVAVLKGYAVTWRGRERLREVLPTGVDQVAIPMAARPLHRAWERVDGPVIEWWTGPIDVVHGTNFVVPPAARAARVVSVHDASFVRFPDLCEPATLRYPALIRRAVASGAWVHVLTHAMADEIAECFAVPPERIRVVFPGVDPGPAGATGTGRLRALEEPPFVLSLGRSERRKDLVLLVDAFDEVADQMADVELVIAGPPGGAEEDLRAAIDRARHRTRIRRLGWVADVEKQALLSGAAAFAYPSVYEGFGIPPLEAMAAGVPVVTTDAGGIPEAVGEAAVVVPVGDREALAHALVRVLEEDGLRERLGDAGAHQVRQFSWARCADGLYQLYLDAAAANGRRPRGRRAPAGTGPGGPRARWRV
jgi:glycosyltransferase involved in cell wall biosynthesis